MTDPVFFAADLPAAARVGDTFELTGPEARHAVAVRRIRVGEAIEIVDGAGTRLRGRATAVGANPPSLTLGVEDRVLEPAPSPELILVQALGKGGRDEAAIEAATELGVDAVVAWQAERSVARWDGPKVAKGVHRWESILVAAAKQSRRARFPRMLGFAAGPGILGVGGPLGPAIAAGARILVLHESAEAPLTAMALGSGRDAGPADRPVVVVVGPEGGLSEAELARWSGAGGTATLLGPHVLRTSTAGPAALTVLNARLGRW
ncbi:16S rRNA (uracil(1498)-N(3))-methyltransferase [Pseudactinotalea sp. HY158]|uniref:16S rRNA (uracil(1498)-N(3))-methyltransferase n=1 Tax=Pseudactinotalea sp. HY158 TaxID=2654547 RepID=UPI00129C9615|nr:16S rRNA (uracil(1498)-N(3))-methyltransferase [Pseudactinotalea sp. HY158]QGH69553.1 16S rRNA (uracil(1498)-N(3))-methyltransferase [Pseudactinotalea sp. HY158]